MIRSYSGNEGSVNRLFDRIREFPIKPFLQVLGGGVVGRLSDGCLEISEDALFVQESVYLLQALRKVGVENGYFLYILERT